MSTGDRAREVLKLMARDGMIKDLTISQRTGICMFLTRDGKSRQFMTGSLAGAMWLLEHFTRWVRVDANTDSYEFIGPQRWTVRVTIQYNVYGSGVGRSLAEAVWRAFWHMWSVTKPTPPGMEVPPISPEDLLNI